MPVPEWMSQDPRLRHHHHRDAQPGLTVAFPDWVSDPVRDAFAGVGIERLWQHQADAASAAFSGRSVAMATPTASGKSAAYLLPVIAAGLDRRLGFAVDRGPLDLDRGHSALYLAPTKALAHDQLRACRELGLPGWQPIALDGDSSDGERRFARELGQFVLTNPDMLHRSVLPSHHRWTRLLSTLRYVVIDEAHRYRGVFGAHTAAVLRRLRRLAHHYGADPVFISASATLSGPGELLQRLSGVPEVVEITEDASARPAVDYLIWQPVDDPHHEAAEVMARLVTEGRQVLTFTTSRVQAELVALRAQEQAGAASVKSYRSGYLAEDRRALEAGLQSGRLRGVACTNALELGVDIAGVDAVINCGFPGTLASLRQQAGRAGRAGADALAVLIPKADPLDAYLCEHPELIFEAPVERTVLHPENPQVLALQVAAAAQELPVTEEDDRWFGPTLPAVLERLTATGYLRHRPAGWFWTRPDRAVDSIDLRAAGGHSVEVVDQATGRVLGQVDPSAADRSVHSGAIYLHQGEPWLVTDYRPNENTALVRPGRDGYFTQALGHSDIEIIEQLRRDRLGAAEVFFGTVELSSQVTGFLRRDEVSGTVWDSTPLELPRHTLRTQAVWYTVDAAALADFPAKDLPGAAHAAEHTAIGLLPAFAPCDRWDIGGLSTTLHPDTGKLTVFVHDGAAGGAGFAEQGYARIEPWLSATLDRLRKCPCEAGCPACVVSPKCGNGNEPLNKAAAARLLELILS
ncbi:MAG TPA: DEAD/DEAH box helicase [Propionicimonas sp.]|nr:DEAD/DEAH box helicase [Propionicimonas sp.]